MKLFLRYLKSKAGALALLVAFAVILAACFWLYRLPVEAVLYPSALCLALGAGTTVRIDLNARRLAIE